MQYHFKQPRPACHWVRPPDGFVKDSATDGDKGMGSSGVVARDDSSFRGAMELGKNLFGD
jgi:hypothetical protein